MKRFLLVLLVGLVAVPAAQAAPRLKWRTGIAAIRVYAATDSGTVRLERCRRQSRRTIKCAVHFDGVNGVFADAVGSYTDNEHATLRHGQVWVYSLWTVPARIR